MKSKKYKYPFARISDRETYVHVVDGDIYTSTTATSCDALSVHDWRRLFVGSPIIARSVIKGYNKRLGPRLNIRDDFLISAATEKCDSDAPVEKQDYIFVSPDSAITRSL